MPFNILIRRDLSLTALADIHRSGGSVTKSPHIGNIYPNNLAVAKMGIPLNIYDRTIGERDRNFHPHRVIVGGMSETIADHRILTTHARVERESQLVPHRFPIDARTTDCHMQALRDAIPKADLVVYTDYLERHIDRVLPILELVTDRLPKIWERTVSETGVITRRGIQTGWKEIVPLGVMGLPATHLSGWVIPNVLNTLLDVILESAERGIADVYHLSGPDMVKYIHQFDATLTELYDHVRSRLDWRLPETLRFHVVPVADMRFAVREERRAPLDALVEGWLDFQRENRSRGDVLKNAADDYERDRIIARLNESRNRVIDRIRAALDECVEIFYRIEDANALTQYDLLAGAKLYVHPWGTESSMQDVTNAFAFFSRTFSKKEARPIHQ
ncbi:MAG: hypothetical protein Q8P82_00975 [bacterium]|nr:hypothetical protein [bacterium]